MSYYPEVSRLFVIELSTNKVILCVQADEAQRGHPQQQYNYVPYAGAQYQHDATYPQLTATPNFYGNST